VVAVMVSHVHDVGGMNEGSSEEKSASSHWTGWAISILAVPFLYILLLPPLWFLSVKDHRSPPKFWLACGTPYEWIGRNTPLGPALNSYANYWRETLRPASGRPSP
jgi:hypothetical protein